MSDVMKQEMTKERREQKREQRKSGAKTRQQDQPRKTEERGWYLFGLGPPNHRLCRGYRIATSGSRTGK